MKIKYQSIVVLFVVLFFSNTLTAQGLSLSQLQSTLEMSNWEAVNQYISNRNWEYYSSEKGDDEHYDKIVWSYDKDYYEDKAKAWFSVFAYDNKPQKISYQAEKDIIMGIKNSLNSYGYNLKNSNIEDDYLTSVYENSKYIIEVFASSSNDDYVFGSVITYSLVLIKKEGIYDENNGDVVVYWEGTTRIKQKYRLKDGELHGEVITYYRNGNIEMKSNWLNGEKTGKVEEYDEYGNKLYEYYLSNGEPSGSFIDYYSNGKVKKRGSKVNGKDSGFFTEYTEDGVKTEEYNMLEDLLNGTYTSYYDNGQINMSGIFKDGEKNGYFVEYGEDGVRMLEYNMENGILNGFFIFYHENGKVFRKGNHVKGKKSGLFSDYDKEGNLILESELENDKLHGTTKEYLNNEVVLEKEYQYDMLSGNYKEVFYVGENNEHKILGTGSYKNNEKHGTWKLFLANENKLLTLTNYQNGVKHGAFQEVEGDSLIFGSYNNGLLEGEYKIYKDLTKMFMGGIINPDSSELKLVTEGTYKKGKKELRWNFYGLNENLIQTGYYQSDKKYGKWSYYYDEYIRIGNSEPLEYSGELYLTENYKDGLKDGVSIRYSFLESVSIPCKDMGLNGDDCKRNLYTKYYQKATYKNDVLNGEIEGKDSTGQLQYKGQLLNDKKHGEWFERGDDNTYEKGQYTSGERTGEWDYFMNDKLIGKFLYKKGELKEVNKYNAAGFVLEHYKYDGDKNTYYASYSGTENNKIRDEVKILKRYSSRAIIEVKLYISDTLFIDTYDIPSTDIITTFSFLSGEKDGSSSLYVNGVLLQKGEYKNGKKTGIWEFNYPSQNAQLKVNFYNGAIQVSTEQYYYLNSKAAFDKDFIVFDKKGNIREERSIKDGLRNGKTVYFDATGEKINKERYKDGILQ